MKNRKNIECTTTFVILLLSYLGFVENYEQITQLFANGPSDNNCQIFQIPNMTSPDTYTPYFRTQGIYPTLTCVIVNEGNYDVNLQCITPQGRINNTIALDSYVWMSTTVYPVTFNQYENILYYIYDGQISSFNLATGEIGFTIPEEFKGYIGDPLLYNFLDNLLYIPTGNTYQITMTEFTLNVLNGTTGTFITNHTFVNLNITNYSAGPKYMYLMYPNALNLNSNTTSTLNTNNFAVVIYVPFISYVTSYNYIALYNAVTFDLVCTISNIEFYSVYTDGTYFYVVQTNQDLLAFNNNCTGLWRIPNFSQHQGDDHSFDYLNHYLYYNSINASSSMITQINTLESSDTNVLQKTISVTSSGFDMSFNNLLGTDISGNYYMLFFSDTSDSELTLQLSQYSSDLNNKPINSYTASLPITSQFYSGFAVITEAGILLWTSPNILYALQCNSENPWRLSSWISMIFLVISLITSILLMIKHKVKGEDPKGWNKAKLYDLIGTIINILGFIIITIVLCLTLNSYVSIINNNTAMFSSNLPSFADNYLRDSCSPSYSIPSIDLCTCTDYDNNLRTSSCIVSSCDNSNTQQCTEVISDACDCQQSIYQWSCDCVYYVNNSCNANITTSSTVNPLANEEWNSCKSQYDSPSFLVNAMIYLTIINTVILTLLNILQIIFAFDNPLLDLIITLFSLLSLLITSIIPSIGLSETSSIDTNCLNELLYDLPGCSFTSTSDVTQMIVDAKSYLMYSFIHLYTTPLMSFISAIPDLLSLCVCCLGSKSEHLEALKNLYNFILRCIGKGKSSLGYDSL